MTKGNGSGSMTAQETIRKFIYNFFDLVKSESQFIFLIAFLFFLCGALSPYPNIAMWLGFALAGYSAIANDSIQTIGTFIASNSHRKWYWLWLYIGIIFLVTIGYSWFTYSGDVSYQRLATKGFSQAPDAFTFLQLSAPVILLILTRLRMPVSTTFLLLSVFSTTGSAIIDVALKSLSGYLVAFVLAIVVWFALSRIIKKITKPKAGDDTMWAIFQWITSGCLWAVWIMQDAANIAIFLPRALDIVQFLSFAAFIFLGLGLLFYLKGDRIQRIVNEKADIRNIRSATIVDFVYAIILYIFKEVSHIPMSTTWVFIGLLGGRELAMSLSRHMKGKKWRFAAKMIGRDVLYAFIGLVVSVILAVSINNEVREDLIRELGF